MLRSMDSSTSPLLSSPLRVYVKKGPWRGGHLVLPFVGNHCVSRHFFTCTRFVLLFLSSFFQDFFTKTSYLLNANQPYFKTFFSLINLYLLIK
jgi:hypothetical protein